MKYTEDAVGRARKVKLIIFDVDGVLTDGGIYVGENGELFKPFFARDGLGITLSHRAGLKTAIITGRSSKQVLLRAEALHIGEVYQGNLDKRAAYRDLRDKLGLRDEEIAYIGDDLVDLPLLVQVGFPAAVGDAMPDVKKHVCCIADLPGGHGAVREILEFILKAQGKWEELLAGFMKPADLKGLAQ